MLLTGLRVHANDNPEEPTDFWHAEKNLPRPPATQLRTQLLAHLFPRNHLGLAGLDLSHPGRYLSLPGFLDCLLFLGRELGLQALQERCSKVRSLRLRKT